MALSELGPARYIRLTTFRRDGTPVPAPVWVVPDREGLAVITGRTTGKVKRLAHTPRVTLARCDSRGRVAPGEPETEGVGRVADDPATVARVVSAIRRKYPVLGTLLLGLERVRGTSAERVVIRIAAA